MDAVIHTHGLTKWFGSKLVVHRLDLAVPQGAIYALLGDNGAGKSTTIRMLTGLLPPDAGRAFILDQDCWAAAYPLRFRYYLERHRGLARRFRPENLRDASARESADAKRVIHRNRTARNRGDRLNRLRAQPDDGAFAELLFDLAQRGA